MPRLLELFCGSKSIGAAFEKEGWEVVSLDSDKRCNASHTIDILAFDYKMYDPGSFDGVWASPPCTEFSIAKTIGRRNLELADQIVQRTLEIITYLDPPVWCIENPYTGMLKSRPYMGGMGVYLTTVS